MIDVLLILVPLLVLVLALTGAMFPFVGMVVFTFAFSWWWPFRAESAATLAAASLDIDQEARMWHRHGYESRSLSNGALATTISTDWIDGISLTVDGTSVPLTVWDAFKLFWAATWWDVRNDRLIRKKANLKAAAKAREWLARQSKRTGA
jgi:hypothetical protein